MIGHQNQNFYYQNYCSSLKLKSDAARSWGGSAVLGVSPMSDCRGSPHERLHQEMMVSNYIILG
ncbi:MULTISPECIES: hypothetical protein [Moorena]|uniref:hypothetical protein n=1 Tax=Moorena TaxID=1155738 RepID=UPI0002DDB0A5|nr:MULTISPECIES: hypothetical protein [Moorena]NER86606.1 hypothetical protein [Moorena sp. SIO3A2]NET63841.1 hypothetical protein [Moorena sp. SIO1G6]